MLQKIFLFLINIFYLFFATSGMGIILGDRFVLSLPVAALIIIDILLIIFVITGQSKFRTKPLIFAVIFIIWAIVITLTRYDISTFILTLLGLVMVWIPLMIRMPLPDKVVLSNFYCQGLILSFVVSYFELFLSILFKQKFVDIFPFIAHKSVGDLSESLNISIDRISSLMTEPSEYAVFLVFGYICLDYLDSQKAISKNKFILIKLNIVFFLLLTFSISGLILFFTYLVLSSLNFLLVKTKRKEIIFKKLLTFLSLIIVLFFAIKAIPELEIASASFIDRATLFIEMDGNDNLKTSEGSRSNSMKLAFDSLGSDYGFFGQGFGKNLSLWILDNYPNTVYSRGEAGEIYNTYAAVIIGVGIPGLLAFLGTIYESFKTSKNVHFYQQIFFLIWLSLGFFIGSLLFYSYWGIFYLVATEANIYNIKKRSR
jgi:hypothetical protein